MEDIQPIADEFKIRVIWEEYVVIPPSPRNTAAKVRMALALLREEGYTIHYAHVMYGGEPKVRKILASPGVTYKEVYENLDKIDQ